MRAIFINNMRRLLAQKQLIVLQVVFITAATIAAIVVSTQLSQSWHIAVVSKETIEIEADSVNITALEQEPGLSDLVSGKYDAVLRVNDNGDFELLTIKNEETKNQLLAALNGQPEDTAAASGRGIGTNVLGYLMMFILLMGSMAMSMYSDDKLQGQITRITASPVGIGSYLFAHGLFNFCFLFIPTMIILCLVRWISGLSLGYSLLQLSALAAIICALSTSFCLMLYSLLLNKADSVKMAGNAIIILTSILAGSFYSFDKGNRALALMITVLPQKAYLTLANNIEQGSGVASYRYSLLYLLVIIAAFFVVSVIKTKSDYVNQQS